MLYTLRIRKTRQTEVAIDFAHSRESHLDAIFWIQAGEVAKLAESFDRVGRALKLLDPNEAGDRVINRNRVLHWLSEPIKELNTHIGYWTRNMGSDLRQRRQLRDHLRLLARTLHWICSRD